MLSKMKKKIEKKIEKKSQAAFSIAAYVYACIYITYSLLCNFNCLSNENSFEQQPNKTKISIFFKYRERISFNSIYAGIHSTKNKNSRGKNSIGIRNQKPNTRAYNKNHRTQ